ncbi:protein slender lobes [Culex quinquefasciatus]|uniref:protein slender lobes n=1 Tax=Culex quinquefasciatus TaxID=7176 RepID=UPI0018E3A363|nr:protein slender lobes [Culex quinquefasciatus]
MSQEEESSGRVTRGALRRRSIDQDTSIGPGTPKKSTAASAKKGPALDAILETNGTEPTPRGVNKAVQKLKELEPEKAIRRSRAASLTEENVEAAQLGGSGEVRRTPRRRASQDHSVAEPQTAPAATRRMTRRNSVTSDDGSVTAVSTPKASAKSRLNVSVAPPTIVEDDEKDTSNAEANLSDLDIRKLRNRSISNSPVPRGSPTGKNGSMREEEPNTSTKGVSILLQDIVKSPKPATPVASPTKAATELAAETSVVEMEPLVVTGSNAKLNEIVEMTPSKTANTSQQPRKSVSGSAQKLQKSVTFDELGTPERQNNSAYPRTPVPASAEKSFKFGEKEEEEKLETEVAKSPEKKSPEVFDIDETVQESPKEAIETKPTKPAPGTPQKTGDQSSVEIADKSSADLDRSLANIVEDVRENMATVADMSILGTPAKPPKGGLLSRLREGSCSTPIADEKKKPLGSPKFVSNTPDGRGQKDGSGDAGEKLSKSWSQAVKGSAGKGIDVFSVRKQEEQERKDEETKRLNESLKESAKKRKSPKKAPSEDEDDEEVGVSDLLGGESSQDGSNFIDDEAMEVDGYESGDSINSEDRQEMEDNEVPEHGETIGSEDSDSDEDEEGDDDSFIAPEDEEEEPELLEGTGDDLDGSDVEQDKSKTKKRKRIIQVVDTSDDEKEVSKKDLTTVSLDRTATASENSAVEVVKSPKKTPVKAVEQSPKKTPAKAPEQSPKKTAAKSPAPAVKQSLAKELEKAPTVNPTDAPKSRKSMPPPLLISADFYSPAAKKAKRATINVLANDEQEEGHEPVAAPKKTEKPGLLANPAALALAKKNKRQSLDQTPASSADKKPENKRASLPGKLPADKPLDKSLVRGAAKKDKKQDIPEEEEEEEDGEPEPMDVDEVEDEGEDSEVEQVVPQKKKRVKDLSEFDADAILNRCNEIVRADKERKKQSATLRQKKKDEKRRQRELDQAEGSGEDKEGDDSGSPDKKKKKKKKKPINYMLEELGETKEEQVARALKRKLALLEAKRERKKAKKAAKLQRQLNKENQDGGENQAAGGGGIGAKFEKKAKKKDKKSSVVEQLVTEPAVEVPKVKLAVSAFQAYKEQIEELGKEQQSKGKKKTKQLKEKNQQQQQAPTAVEEVKAALQVESTKPKKEKKKVSEVVADEVPPPESDQPKKKKKLEQPEAPQKAPKKSSEVMQQEALAEQKKLDEELAKLKKAISEPIPKMTKKPKSQAEQRKLDEDLAKLKQALSDPVAKVVKKQKLPNQEKPTVTCPEVESTPPRKLKALARLESGFTEEPVTPEQQKIRRNHGFREEPVTPKPVGFKVSAVLPTGQQELVQRAALTKKHNKKAANANRVRPEDVQEPVRSLPIPVWTRSGKFEVEELTAAAGKKKTKRAKSLNDDDGGYIPVNGGGSAKSSTEFLVKPLSAKKEASAKKANRIDLATVDDEVINFKKQAIFGKTAHLREKKSKH